MTLVNIWAITKLFFSPRDVTNIYWHSNAIIERIEYNKLKTLSGNIYILKGMIDLVSMKEAGNESLLIDKPF